MDFSDKLNCRWQTTNSLLCIGIDFDPRRLKFAIDVGSERDVLDYLQRLVDSTQKYACAYKPQFAHFAAHGLEKTLAALIAYIHGNYPDLPVILDAKRNDIGSTSAYYAIELFDRYGADAATINPFLGWDTVEPFLSFDSGNRGVFVVCRTSNPGSDWLQEQSVSPPIYIQIAKRVATENHRNLGLVIGATTGDSLAIARRVATDNHFLVPGIGTQGGDLNRVLSTRRESDGLGLIINVSRDILYPDGKDDYFTAVADKARKYAQQMPARTS